MKEETEDLAMIVVVVVLGTLALFGFIKAAGDAMVNGDYNDSACDGAMYHDPSLDPCVQVCQRGHIWYSFGSKLYCHRELKKGG